MSSSGASVLCFKTHPYPTFKTHPHPNPPLEGKGVKGGSGSDPFKALFLRMRNGVYITDRSVERQQAIRKPLQARPGGTHAASLDSRPVGR